MGLFDKLKKQETILNVSEAQQKLYSSLTEYTGWKFLKSQRCLRKNIDNIVFDIVFYSSKYNCSGKHIEVNCEFLFWNKDFDKTCNVNSKIGFILFKPNNNYWFDISTNVKLEDVIEELKSKIDKYVFPLINKFEENYDNSIIYLSDDNTQELYNLKNFAVFEKMENK